MPSNNVTAPLASTLNLVVSWWLPTWQQSAEFPDLYGLCLQRTTMKHFRRVPTGLTHCYHAQQQRHCPLGFYITCGGLMVAAYMAAKCGISRVVRLVPPAHHYETLLQSSNRPNALQPCPATTSLPPWLLHYMWWSHGRSLHCSMPSNNVTAPLASTILVVVSWWLPTECGISRFVRLVPPAHHHETLSQSSNRPNALLPCPATMSLPPWLLH
jgi:hypothetical protein